VAVAPCFGDSGGPTLLYGTDTIVAVTTLDYDAPWRRPTSHHWQKSTPAAGQSYGQ
jgi:hypothetical protein